MECDLYSIRSPLGYACKGGTIVIDCLARLCELSLSFRCVEGGPGQIAF